MHSDEFRNWKFIDLGYSDGIRYVDVLDDGLNPIDYAVPLDEAVETYGDHSITNINDL